jgi:hypothetical protein
MRQHVEHDAGFARLIEVEAATDRDVEQIIGR